MLRALVLGMLAFVMISPAVAGTPQADNEAKTQHFYDEINKGNLGVINELFADNYVDHEPFPGMKPDRDGCSQFFAMMRTAFPDLNLHVNFMMADANKVAAYITITGTQKGEFMGMPASGKHFSVDAIDIIRIVDGKAVEHWGVTDGMAMMQQLGAGAPPAPAGH